MKNKFNRRHFLAAAGAAPVVAATQAAFAAPAAMMCFGMVPVGGRPPAFLGGTLVSADNRIDGDEPGLTTARDTGARVADFALKLTALAS